MGTDKLLRQVSWNLILENQQSFRLTVHVNPSVFLNNIGFRCGLDEPHAIRILEEEGAKS